MRLLTLHRSIIGLAVTVALAAALLAVAAPASAADSSPIGAVDTVNGVPTYYAGIPEGAPYISGWTMDPDFWWLPVTVRADFTWYRNYCRFAGGCVVANTSVTQLANLNRSDIYPIFGTHHGFNISVPPLPRLTSYDFETVCVTALDAYGGGTDTTLGCYQLPF
jgi:hypothetical protein